MRRLRGGLARPWLAAALLVAAATLPAAEAATAWTTALAQSRLEFTGTLGGGQFGGRFADFDADVAFDPADLAASHLRVTVRTGSADTADSDRDAALASADFFDAARWPTATYDAGRFVITAPGQYQAHGTLTIRGVARELPITFTFKASADGQSAALTGNGRIHRLDFGIGQGEWQDTNWLANEVNVRCELILRRRK
jgi:polyisoprenoid-binding protein YceI